MLWKTELKTGTKPICLVKLVIPRRLLSCCRETMIAAPAMKPIRVAFERKSIINPSLQFKPKKKKPNLQLVQLFIKERKKLFFLGWKDI